MMKTQVQISANTYGCYLYGHYPSIINENPEKYRGSRTSLNFQCTDIPPLVN